MKIKSLSDVAAIASYLKRIGAEPRSLRTAVVKEMHGSYWQDVAIIHFSSDGAINAPSKYAPTKSEEKAIVLDCLLVEWPTLKLLARLPTNLPDELKEAHSKDLFEFRNMNGDIVMLQHRVERKGEKSYIPWTYWSDDEWRKSEPEGLLPLWGADQLNDHTTVFVHEGAKAARAIREMVEAKIFDEKEKLAKHPWGDELSSAAHLGWIGGALSPDRTDWSILQKAGVKRVYIVSDNDAPGVSAVPKIAFHLRVPTFQIQFTNEWPGSFDLADEFPEKMFRYLEGWRYYIGPSFRSCIHPATWATDQILAPDPNKAGKEKTVTVLRKNFKDMWSYVEEADLFVCVEMPEILRTEAVMNKMLAAFSHTNQTSLLIVRSYTGRSAKLCYRPDIKGRLVTDNTTSAINLHTPTHIKSVAGNIEPFMEYMTYLLPNEDERLEALRWIATLIAKPEIHMEYGMLLVSENQGIGKTTLGASILSPLVGVQNVSAPTTGQIVQSEFNGWIANKRLCVINEIYEGHSWKAYNKLKSVITDREIEVNEKYQRAYIIENWCHVFACSNSLKALRIEDSDRRWFYPEIIEDKWPASKFDAFYNWLRSGGLSIIKDWAENYGNYVQKGQPAPATRRKKELIISSRTEGQQTVAELAEAMNELNFPVVIAMKDIVDWTRKIVQGKIYDSDYDLKKVMRDQGVIWLDERFLINGRQQIVAMNVLAFEIMKETNDIKITKNIISLNRHDEDDPVSSKLRKKQLFDDLRKMVKHPSNIMEEQL